MKYFDNIQVFQLEQRFWNHLVNQLNRSTATDLSQKMPENTELKLPVLSNILMLQIIFLLVASAVTSSGDSVLSCLIC
jgi:hypothetical protein